MRVIIRDNSIYDIGSHIPVDEASANFIGIAKFSRLAASYIEKIAEYANNKLFINAYYTSVLMILQKKIIK